MSNAGALLQAIILPSHPYFDEGLASSIDEAGDDSGTRLKKAARWLVRFHTEYRREARIGNEDYRSLLPEQAAEVLDVRRRIPRRFEEILHAGG